MEDKRPYEELDSRFSNLPLPDEDKAWEDMKARLEKDDDDRFIVVPTFLQGCTGWILLTLVLGGALWLYTLQTREQKSQAVTSGEAPGAYATKGKSERRGDTVSYSNPALTPTATPNEPGQAASKRLVADTITDGEVDRTGQAVAVDAAGAPRVKANARVAAPVSKNNRIKEDRLPTPGAVADNHPGINNQQPAGVRNVPDSVEVDTAARHTDTAVVQKEAPRADSVKSAPLQRVVNRKFRIGAGLALQQQLPVGRQEWTPYNYRGRKGSLADYVPSLYVRLYSRGRWFLQTEFRYGAPQYTREFIYNKEFKADTLGGTSVLSSSSYRLKKTYYHQIPVSLNYWIKPSWSVGTGIVYNRFFGAVSEKEVRNRVSATLDTLVSKGLVRDRNESLFHSTNLQWLMESQYHRRRLSLGGRFAQGLQPYIEYKDASGQAKREKNFSFSLFMRYELWNPPRN